MLALSLFLTSCTLRFLTLLMPGLLRLTSAQGEWAPLKHRGTDREHGEPSLTPLTRCDGPVEGGQWGTMYLEKKFTRACCSFILCFSSSRGKDMGVGTSRLLL